MPLIRNLRRAAIASLLAIAAPLVLPSGARADGQGCPSVSPGVRVVVHGAEPKSVLLDTDQLVATTNNASVRFRRAVGVAPIGDTFACSVWIRDLLTTAGVALPSVQNVRVSVPSRGGVSVLSKDQLAPNYPFENGAFPGIGISSDLWYFRPLVGGDVNDVNTPDSRIARAGEVLTLDVYTQGAILHPTIRVSPATPRAGDDITFSVTFSDADVPAGLDYHWTFGDGTTGSGPAPHHSYSKAWQAVQVNLTVGSETADNYGVAPTVTLQINEKKQHTKKNQPGSGGSGKGGSKNGPVSSKGHNAGAQRASTVGTSEADHATAKQQAQSGNAGSKNGPTTVTVIPVSGTLLDVTTADRRTREQASAPIAAPSANALPDLRDWRWLWLLVVPGLMLLGGVGQSRAVRRRLPQPTWRRL